MISADADFNSLCFEFGLELDEVVSHSLLYFFLEPNQSVSISSSASYGKQYGHVLRREDDNILRMALGFEVEGQRKKERLKRT